jgi:transposase-like protein
VRGKRGRGAANKIAVVGLLERKGKVFTSPVDRCTKEEILPIILERVKCGVDIYTDGWRSYDALAVYGFNHKRVLHEQNEFSRGDGEHINGIESFWSYAKRRLAKFNGLRKTHFDMYLKETEWRFNHRDSIEKEVRKLVRARTLIASR